MAYVSSSSIEIFPVAKKRIDATPGTRIFTENNVSNIIRQLLSASNPGFIISCTTSAGKFNISFNLYGYYFNIKEFGIPSEFNGASSIYACIGLKDGEIYGQDESGEYTGLNLCANPESLTISDGMGNALQKKYIKLFDKVSGQWECTQSNFGLVSSLSIGGIDGKRN